MPALTFVLTYSTWEFQWTATTLPVSDDLANGRSPSWRVAEKNSWFPDLLTWLLVAYVISKAGNTVTSLPGCGAPNMSSLGYNTRPPLESTYRNLTSTEIIDCFGTHEKALPDRLLTTYPDEHCLTYSPPPPPQLGAFSTRRPRVPEIWWLKNIKGPMGVRLCDAWL
jgi:hypothetical protein